VIDLLVFVVVVLALVAITSTPKYPFT